MLPVTRNDTAMGQRGMISHAGYIKVRIGKMDSVEVKAFVCMTAVGHRNKIFNVTGNLFIITLLVFLEDVPVLMSVGK